VAGVADAVVDEPEALARDDGEGFGVVGHGPTVAAGSTGPGLAEVEIPALAGGRGRSTRACAKVFGTQLSRHSP
jgi:hypothetical protein